MDSLSLPDGKSVPLRHVQTLVVGSGAAGLNAAVQLHRRGVTDILILTEGLQAGTSINTGSDKQTYYKLSLCDNDNDSPREMAETFFSGGSMHGDLALVEASCSARGFLNLVELGVRFPTDAYGQFVGYKTDHDPRKRATSVGPYTSKEMCLRLIDEVKRRGIEVVEQRTVAAIATIPQNDERGNDGGAENNAEDNEGDFQCRNHRAVGVVALTHAAELEAYAAENIIYAVGGPGGLYKTSVYPAIHTGAIGVALLAGAAAQSLPECQYGLASTKFRWNVSGTYMQVIPKFVSTDADGVSNPREFLREAFDAVGDMNSMVFLKGYQWPFDPRKAIGGSSLVDILVYQETVLRGRRVFLDFRENPEGFAFDALSDEAREYLEKSDALQATPIERLGHMNPGAISLYKDHGIDITAEPLEIAVCAQHNNGGLAADHWWESVNVSHLFPVGEVNGSHGVYRPGGSALNSGQVGSLRAAEKIAACYCIEAVTTNASVNAIVAEASKLNEYLNACKNETDFSWRDVRAEFQARMTTDGAHLRATDGLKKAVAAATEQWQRVRVCGGGADTSLGVVQAVQNRQLCFAHLVYLNAMFYAVISGIGSRGSAMVLSGDGDCVHASLPDDFRLMAENEAFREKVQETVFTGGDDVDLKHRWIERRPIPISQTWFETAWAAYRNGDIYQ